MLFWGLGGCPITKCCPVLGVGVELAFNLEFEVALNKDVELTALVAHEGDGGHVVGEALEEKGDGTGLGGTFAAVGEGAWSKGGGRGSAELRGGEGAARGAEGAGEIGFEGGTTGLEGGVVAAVSAVFRRSRQFPFRLHVGQPQAGEVVSGGRGPRAHRGRRGARVLTRATFKFRQHFCDQILPLRLGLDNVVPNPVRKDLEIRPEVWRGRGVFRRVRRSYFQFRRVFWDADTRTNLEVAQPGVP